MLFIKDY